MPIPHITYRWYVYHSQIDKLVVYGIALPTSYRNPPPRICQPPSDHGKADSAARACSTPKESVCALDAGKSYLGVHPSWSVITNPSISLMYMHDYYYYYCYSYIYVCVCDVCDKYDDTNNAMQYSTIQYSRMYTYLELNCVMMWSFLT